MVYSHYKRICDKIIGGCGKKMDIVGTVSVIKGQVHLCIPCAGKILAEKFHVNRIGGEK